VVRRGARGKGEEAHRQHVVNLVASVNGGGQRTAGRSEVQGTRLKCGGSGGQLQKLGGTHGACCAGFALGQMQVAGGLIY
jgi:hypothetical protein